MTSDENPYAAPLNEASGQFIGPRGNPLIMPAIFILLFAIPYLLLLVVGAFGSIWNIDVSTPHGMGQLVGQVFFLICVLSTTTLEIFGAVCMIQMKRYGFAMTSAVLSIVPICSPCYVFGIPFGIWALIVLLQTDVKDRFT